MTGGVHRTLGTTFRGCIYLLECKDYSQFMGRRRSSDHCPGRGLVGEILMLHTWDSAVA